MKEERPRSDALVFLGATGDLAYKKIFPALQAMARRGHLDFPVIGVAKAQYTRVSERGEYLQHKQAQGMTLSDDEIEDFEKDRQNLLNNPVARGFLDAQQEMHRLQESVGAYVQKTFELGRVPTADDFDQGSCGHGCGCHH